MRGKAFSHLLTQQRRKGEKNFAKCLHGKKNCVLLQHEFKIGKNMANDKNASKPKEKKPKKVNKTWEAMGKYQGAFTIIDLKFVL